MGDRFPFGKAPFWLFVTALLSTSLLFATTRERPPRPDLVLATFVPHHLEAYEQIVPEFERRYNVTVHLQLMNRRALTTRLQNAVLAGTEVPDLVELEEGTLGFFTRGPKEDIGFLDLTDRLKREGLMDDIVSSRFSLWSARGRIYALPHDVHPVMLAYRRDLVEKLGIDVDTLQTWDDFVAMGRRVTRDLDGDGVIDRYALDLPRSGGWGLHSLLLQRGQGLFDEQGRVIFDTALTADTMAWYLEQTRGPSRISYDCGWGQTLLKAMGDGLALFYVAADWRSHTLEVEVPKLSGKMALMPLPAWEPGGRRTTVWGGTGLAISKTSKKPDLAWKFAKFLYFHKPGLGKRFLATNIIPPLESAWDLPEFKQPNRYFSGQPIGQLYAELAKETPPAYSSAVHRVATAKLDEVLDRSARYYEEHGKAGLIAHIRRELEQAADYVRRIDARNDVFLRAD